jgi:hypothetical protein
VLRNRLSRGAATLVSHRVPATLYSSCTRVQNPKGNWAGLADALAVEIHGEARLAA